MEPRQRPEHARAERGSRALEEVEILQQERHAGERTLRQALFDLPFGTRRMLLRRSILDLNHLAQSREACAAIVRKVAAGVHHVSGTCRIGRPNDEMAVVDPDCRVLGVKGLRVADASVMPTVVSANTHLAVLMIGEKVAQAILDERDGAASAAA